MTHTPRVNYTPRILLASAVSWEIRPLGKSLLGNPDIVVRTLGIGGARAGKKLESILGEVEPQAVVLVGFSGGVKEAQKMGDIALPTVFSCEVRPKVWRREVDMEMRDTVESRLRPSGVRLLREVRAMTVTRVAGPTQKRVLGKSWPGTCGVDMESYSLAEVCSRADVPFFCVRVIFDEVDQRLPSFGNFWKLPIWHHRASNNLALATGGVLDVLQKRSYETLATL